VEDEVLAARALALLLHMQGYEVRVAVDGLAALGAVREGVPDVILLDMGLPGMDGYAVARWLREQPFRRRPLIIAITGQAATEDVRRAQEAGIDLHLAKPVEPEAIERLLRRFQAFIGPGPN